jgi:hypothetical protein
MRTLVHLRFPPSLSSFSPEQRSTHPKQRPRSGFTLCSIGQIFSIVISPFATASRDFAKRPNVLSNLYPFQLPLTCTFLVTYNISCWVLTSRLPQCTRQLSSTYSIRPQPQDRTVLERAPSLLHPLIRHVVFWVVPRRWLRP